MNKEISLTRKEQSEITRQRLLDSARELFSKYGYKGTSVRSVSRRLNLADGLLYHYFPSGKKEIFQTIVTEEFEKIADDIRTMQSDNIKLPLEQVLESSYKRFTEIVDKNIDIIRIIIRENEVREFVTKESILSIVECNKGQFADCLKKKAELGEVREMDFEIAALTLKSILVNYILIKVLDIDVPGLNNSDYMKKIVKYLVELWTNAQ